MESPCQTDSTNETPSSLPSSRAGHLPPPLLPREHRRQLHRPSGGQESLLGRLRDDFPYLRPVTAPGKSWRTNSGSSWDGILKCKTMAKIYVASSWRNQHQPEVVDALRKEGHKVYDFRNPKDNPGGFRWSDVDENWQEWQPEEYIRNLTHPVAEKGFKADLDAMLWADTCVLVLPCGRSAHTEAGWFAGRGLKTHLSICRRNRSRS